MFSRNYIASYKKEQIPKQICITYHDVLFYIYKHFLRDLSTFFKFIASTTTEHFAKIQ